MQLQCPSCGSTQVQPHAVVHADGTQRIRLDHAGTVGGEFAQVTSYGTQTTALAQHCAPPAPPSPMPFVIAYGIGGVLIYMAMTVCPLLARECVYVGTAALRHNWKQATVGLGVIAVGWLLMKAWYLQAQAYNAAKRQWQNTWFCHACGRSHVRS